MGLEDEKVGEAHTETERILIEIQQQMRISDIGPLVWEVKR